MARMSPAKVHGFKGARVSRLHLFFCLAMARPGLVRFRPCPFTEDGDDVKTIPMLKVYMLVNFSVDLLGIESDSVSPILPLA